MPRGTLSTNCDTSKSLIVKSYAALTAEVPNLAIRFGLIENAGQGIFGIEIVQPLPDVDTVSVAITIALCRELLDAFVQVS